MENFLDNWKISKFCIIFKIQNYLKLYLYVFICILCIFLCIYNFLHDQISEYEQVFVNNLLTITRYLSGALDNNDLCELLYTDFQKALDRVDHGNLYGKLHDNRFNNGPLLLLNRI